MSSSESEVLTFGPFRLDLRTRQLFRWQDEAGDHLGGEVRPVLLQARALAVLVFLARRPGEEISKEELLESVWDGTAVTEDSLTQAISQIRKALGDDARSPTYVQTISGLGYRFIGTPLLETGERRHRTAFRYPSGEAAEPIAGPTTDLDNPSGPEGARHTAATHPWRRHPWFAGTGVVLVALGAVVTVAILSMKPGDDAAEQRPVESVAVLAFENRTGDPEMAYLAQGIPEALANRLATIDTLSVAPRGLVNRFGPTTDFREVVDELGVEGVVTGWVDVVDGRPVVGAALVDGRRAVHLWGHTYSRAPGNLIELQSALTHDIVRELRPQLAPAAHRRVTSVPTEDPLAWELFLKADRTANGGEGDQDALESALALAREAVQRDRGFAQAQSLVARLYTMLGFWNFRPHQEVLPLAQEAAAAALDADPRLPEAHAIRGWTMGTLEWRWHDALAEVRTALTEDPDNVTALVLYSNLLPTVGKIDEAIDAAIRAHQRAPLDTLTIQSLAWALFQGRRWDEAIEYLDKLLEEDPGSQWAWTFKLLAMAESGRHEEAVKLALARGASTTPDADHVVGAIPITLASLYIRGGDHAEARRLLRDLPAEHVPPGNWARLGEKDRAFEGLERYVSERRTNFLMYLKTASTWDPLRDDPRFNDILRRVGLPLDSP